MQREFDMVVFGASGFTGRLVAQYLRQRTEAGESYRWAMAGRNLEKLLQVRTSIGANESIPIIAADANDPKALAELVARCRVVITTVGPYQRYGQTLVQACAAAGCDYVDLCGEPGWMVKMIPELQLDAAKSGARIVFSCGFDSIPFDLGVVFLQESARAQLGMPLSHVSTRVHRLKGGMSGGTLASAIATIEHMRVDPKLGELMANPFALTEGFVGPEQAEISAAVYDEWSQTWSAPFMMATINTKNVHRSNYLRGHPWGKDFVYDERMFCGGGSKGQRRAKAMAQIFRLQNTLLGFTPTRQLLSRFVLPKPGQGPSQAERDSGYFELLISGATPNGDRLTARVKGDRDPGYGSTSKMISESAVCLLRDVDRSMTAGGVWTAGAAMGLTLVRRLEAFAGLNFSIVDS